MIGVLKKGVGACYRWLCSTEAAVLLLLAIGLLAIPGATGGPVEGGCSPLVTVLLSLIAVSTFLCTVRRLKSLPVGVVVIHLGVMVTMAGALGSRLGSVSTVNIYEGESVSSSYRWDLRADTPLGFDLWVKKINMEYYPAPVRVGVLRGGEKVALFTLVTGGSFELDGCAVTVDSLDPGAKKITFSVYQGGRLLGKGDSDGAAQDLPAAFPYAFRLVSYKKPAVKRMWADLALTRGAEGVADGVSEVNAPLHFGELDLFLVQTSVDPYGRRYAGIQLVRDPGRPVVFGGFILVSLGALLTFWRRFRVAKESSSFVATPSSSSPASR